MMLATDFYALMGIDLVMCAVFLRIASLMTQTSSMRKTPVWAIALSAALLGGLWLPWGDAGLPLLAYVRGVLSDFSVTSVLISVFWIAQSLGVMTAVQRVEKQVTYAVLVLGATLLYPTALGLGDWDAYRLGWGTPGLLMSLSLLALSSFLIGWRRLPLLISAAVAAWSVGFLESGNLWDYLIDPWLACVAIAVSLKSGLGRLRQPAA